MLSSVTRRYGALPNT